MATITTARSLDRRSKSISTFVVFDVVAELRDLEVGDILEVLTDDLEPLSRDIAAWSEAVGHRLLGTESTPRGRTFLIEKGAEKSKDASFAMILSPDGLEELLSPLGFALAAGLEGMHVSLYIQGPAVRVLARGYRPKLGGWARPFSRFAAAQMERSGHIAAQDKLRQLRSLGASIYMCGPSMEHFKVRKEDLIFDDLPLVEYLSFMPIMERADVSLFV